ncbi:putative aBC transporter ATP-binding protein, partial [Vibrio parahaemolyticus V-223/04]
SPVWS